jgi:hypothetical protein
MAKAYKCAVDGGGLPPGNSAAGSGSVPQQGHPGTETGHV